jgi:hypothetical protein
MAQLAKQIRQIRGAVEKLELEQKKLPNQEKLQTLYISMGKQQITRCQLLNEEPSFGTL